MTAAPDRELAIQPTNVMSTPNSVCNFTFYPPKAVVRKKSKELNGTHNNTQK